MTLASLALEWFVLPCNRVCVCHLMCVDSLFSLRNLSFEAFKTEFVIWIPPAVMIAVWPCWGAYAFNDVTMLDHAAMCHGL